MCRHLIDWLILSTNRQISYLWSHIVNKQLWSKFVCPFGALFRKARFGNSAGTKSPNMTFQLWLIWHCGIPSRNNSPMQVNFEWEMQWVNNEKYDIPYILDLVLSHSKQLQVSYSSKTQSFKFKYKWAFNYKYEQLTMIDWAFWQSK